MSDPHNQFMQQIKYGGESDIKHMYQEQMWHTIREKKLFVKQLNKSEEEAENIFLNSLTEEEYTELLKNKKNLDKYKATGVAPEVYKEVEDTSQIDLAVTKHQEQLEEE